MQLEPAIPRNPPAGSLLARVRADLVQAEARAREARQVAREAAEARTLAARRVNALRRSTDAAVAAEQLPAAEAALTACNNALEQASVANEAADRALENAGESVLRLEGIVRQLRGDGATEPGELYRSAVAVERQRRKVREEESRLGSMAGQHEQLVARLARIVGEENASPVPRVANPVPGARLLSGGGVVL